jgi:hypothetical protein
MVPEGKSGSNPKRNPHSGQNVIDHKLKTCRRRTLNFTPKALHLRLRYAEKAHPRFRPSRHHHQPPLPAIN